METAIFTHGALAVMVTAGWIIDLLVHREPPSRLQRAMTAQIRPSAAAIRDGLGPEESQGNHMARAV